MAIFVPIEYMLSSCVNPSLCYYRKNKQNQIFICLVLLITVLLAASLFYTALPTQSSQQARLAALCDHRYNGIELDQFAQHIQSTGDRYFIAANLYNNEQSLHWWLNQLYTVVRYVHNRLNGESSNLYISIYESGSTDSTGHYLQLADQHLTALGVPHTIIYDGQITKQSVASLSGRYHRIGTLAALRNAALQPLHMKQHGTFTRVIFMNDITYCAADMLWLMSGDIDNSVSDMLCGMDYDTTSHNQLKFYDNWVTKDITGMPLQHSWPAFKYHKPSRASMNTMSITPVQCCWNGLASINANVFYSGIEFRDGGFADNLADQWKCTASEITHFCDDMWASGFNKIGVDPVVQVSYDLTTHDLLSDTTQHWVDQSINGREQRISNIDGDYKFNYNMVKDALRNTSALALKSARDLYDYELHYDLSPAEGWTCCTSRVSLQPAHWCCSIDHPLNKINDPKPYLIGDPWYCGWQPFTADQKIT